MNTWAQQYGSARFLCICALGNPDAKNLAVEMGKQMRLSHCVNGYIDNSRSLPSYGQLGCQGFIVFDHTLKVVSLKTSAFMQIRQLAFKHVESMLSALVAGQRVPDICPGEFLQLHSLSSSTAQQLNGQTGVCIGMEGERLLVALQSGKQLKVLPKNVRKLGDDTGKQEDSAVCGQDSVSSCSNGACGKAPKRKASSCESGQCGLPPRDNTSVPPEGGEPVQLLHGVASVQVGSMDKEHEECVAALNLLLQDRSEASLRAVYDCFAEHFKHEEELFEKHGFGAGGGAFSAAESHKMEHARLLVPLRELLERSPCNISASFAQNVVSDFVEHAEQYDSKYTQHMVSAGAL